MSITELAALITVRDFTFRSIDNILISMSKEEVRVLRAKLTQLDKQIVEALVDLNLTTLSTLKK